VTAASLNVRNIFVLYSQAVLWLELFDCWKLFLLLAVRLIVASMTWRNIPYILGLYQTTQAKHWV